MALNTSKRLHVHTVPFMVLLVGFTMGTTVLFIILSTSSNQSVSKLISVRLYDIQPSANGLAQISRHDTVSKSDNPNIMSIGQGAIWQATVYAP